MTVSEPTQTSHETVLKADDNHSLLGSLLVRLHHSLHADISYIATFQQSNAGHLGNDITAQTIYFIHEGKQSDNFTFQIANTPAQEVFENGNRVISHDAAELFPRDEFLLQNQITAFVGVPIRSNMGSVIGIIAVLYRDELSATSRVISMLHTLSNQISTLLLNSGDHETNTLSSNTDITQPLTTDSKQIKQLLHTWKENLPQTVYASNHHTDLSFNAPSNNNPNPFHSLYESPVDQLADSLEQSHAKYLETIIDSLHDAIITLDTFGTILSANQTAERMFDCHLTDLIGNKVSSLMPEPYASLHNGFMKNYASRGMTNTMGAPQELPAKRQNGQKFPMEISISELKLGGDEKIFIGIIRDISERKKAKDQIYELAYFDPLTRLPNRISFERDVLDVLTRAKLAKGNIYCSLLNIDRFAQINLAYGKSTGDYVLEKVARRIESVLGKSFKLYKNVADSFFLLYRSPIISNNQDALNNIKIQENSIRGTVASQLSLNGNPQNFTISIGSLNIFAREVDHDKLIRLLEFSEQKAKRLGQNSCFSLSSEEKALFERRTLISHSITKGLDNNEFYIELQPLYARNGEIVASEALIRWQSSELGNMSPGEFIHLAEKNGDIVAVGNWVVQEACRLLAKLKKHNNNSKIAINISGKQLMQPDFCQQLMYALAEWRISADKLILEITESTLVKDVELVKERMQYLAEQGFSFSIDDFGTGYSSLIYLKELPIDELKIDRYFVDEINGIKDDVSIVNTIIEMAKALGIRTVAEGIETSEQLHYLLDRGCHVFQGFHLARPLPVEEWLALLVGPKKYPLFTHVDNSPM